MSDGGHFKIDQTTFGAIKEGRQVISSDITKEDKIDTLIAQALNNLTNKQRDTVYHELHGVDNIVEETEEFVASHMEALGTEIDRVKLSHHKGLAYKLAEIISSKYVGDSLFRLKFLRSEKFNVRKCADRMIRFFDCKLHFFGAAKLCDDIALADLDNDDMASLRAGFMQILPVRDQAGRSIFLLLPSLQTYKHIKNMMRVLFYLLVSMVDDKETQKRGGSLIVYHSGKFELKSFDTRTVAQKCWLLDCLPIRTCSLHHCYSDPGFRYTINIEMHFLSEEARARTKLHYGSHNECAHALQTYGVPPDGLPVNMDGELKRRSHLDLIKIRQRQESIAGFPRIVVPTNRDVLFGRGKPFREHNGNMKLFEILDGKLEYYESVSIRQKSSSIVQVVDAVKAYDGRFLRQDEHGCWVEVDAKMAKVKVSHAFRTRLRIASSEIEHSRTASAGQHRTQDTLRMLERA